MLKSTEVPNNTAEDVYSFLNSFYAYHGFDRYWTIPKCLQLCATLNFLRLISSIIFPWVDLIEGKQSLFSCDLYKTERTTAAGWKSESNFCEEINIPKHPMPKFKIEISHVKWILDTNWKDYLKWSRGVESTVNNYLCQADNLSDCVLINVVT